MRLLSGMHLDEAVSFAKILTTGVVGGGLTFYWHLRKKRRELALEMEKDFWDSYGETYLTWKLWNYLFPETVPKEFMPNPEVRREVLQRIAHSEAKMEGVLFKLICERKLADPELEALAKFREAHQAIRHAVHSNNKLEWPSDKPMYESFKANAAAVGYLIATIDIIAPPSPEELRSNIRAATSKKWEHKWHEPLSRELPRVWLCDYIFSRMGERH